MKTTNLALLTGISFFSALLTGPNKSLAQTNSTTFSVMSVLPFSAPNLSNVVVDSQLRTSRSDNAQTYIDLNVYCFGTNLRAVTNPVSPVSQITAKIQFQANDNSYKNYELKFPALAVAKNQSPVLDQVLGDSKVVNPDGTTAQTIKAHVKGNTIRIEFLNTKTIPLDVLSSGVDFGKMSDLSVRSEMFKSILFEQTMPPGTPPSQYMGTDGPLSSSINWNITENGKYVSISAGFPGENGFCGGYFSPLLLKFNDSIPDMSGKSKFPLFEKLMKDKRKPNYSWPQFDKETFFLAWDRDENGKIEHGGEMFGDINGYENGYKNLEAYDDNKDGVIDEKDKIFSKLLLVQDLNGDGRFAKNENRKLSDLKVFSISLKYLNDIRQAGDRAKILGPAPFSYKDKKGEIKTGKTWDVFLTEVP